MFVERVDHFDGFRCLRTAWDLLYQRDPEAQFFLSWTWLASVLESHPGQWLVLVVRDDDGRCVGVLPLRRKTVWSRRQERLRHELEFAGRLFWADYGGILCAPEADQAVLEALAAHLKQLHWSHVYLKGFRISDRRYEIFMRAFKDDRLVVEPQTALINAGQTDNLVCPYVDLPETFEAYLDGQLSSNTRQKVRRFMRRVESSVEYQITLSTAETAARDLDILERLWHSMWGAVKGSKTDRLASTYRTIVAQGVRDGTVHMPILWHGGAAVGVLASFVDWDKSRVLFFVTGRDEACEALPVGLVLHAWSIRWAIAHGLKTYDFLRGDEPYKRSLGATTATHLRYPLVRTRSGTNLNDDLDPLSIAEALQMAADFAEAGRGEHAMTVFYQALSTLAGPRTAERLLDALSDADEMHEVVTDQVDESVGPLKTHEGSS